MSDIKVQFKNWKDKLNVAIRDSLENEVFEKVKEVMKEKIQSEVYDKYEPSKYERRFENGGLLDEKNIQKKIIGYRTLIVENTTNDNGYTGTHRNIVPVVETGKGYSFVDNFEPRPFHKPAEEELIVSDKAKNALLRGIKGRGFQTNI